MAVRFFGDGASINDRACQIWQILVGMAARRETATYERLAHLLGHSQVRVLAKQLGRIMYYCQQNDLPPLTVLVVNKNTGTPGDGLDLSANEGVSRERVFGYDWYNVIPPTPDEFREAHRNHQ